MIKYNEPKFGKGLKYSLNTVFLIFGTLFQTEKFECYSWIMFLSYRDLFPQKGCVNSMVFLLYGQ